MDYAHAPSNRNNLITTQTFYCYGIRYREYSSRITVSWCTILKHTSGVEPFPRSLTSYCYECHTERPRLCSSMLQYGFSFSDRESEVGVCRQHTTYHIILRMLGRAFTTKLASVFLEQKWCGDISHDSHKALPKQSPSFTYRHKLGGCPPIRTEKAEATNLQSAPDTITGLDTLGVGDRIRTCMIRICSPLPNHSATHLHYIEAHWCLCSSRLTHLSK